MSPIENPLPLGEVLFITVFLKFLEVFPTELAPPLEFVPVARTDMSTNVAFCTELPPAVLSPE